MIAVKRALAIAVFLSLSAFAEAAGASSYVVVYKNTVGDVGDTTSTLQSKFGFASSFRYGSALKGFAASLTDRQLSQLNADPEVAFVEPDVTFTAAGTVALAPGETEPVGIRRIGAGTTTAVHLGSGVNVAELDTGIDLNNADLNAVS